MEYNVFFSYESKNKEAVDLYHRIKKEIPGLKIWYDRENMANYPTKINQELRDGIYKSSSFICCLNSNYLKSSNCMNEFSYACQLEKIIFYVLFDGTDDLQIYRLIDFNMGGLRYYTPNKFDILKKALIESLAIVVCYN